MLFSEQEHWREVLVPYLPTLFLPSPPFPLLSLSQGCAWSCLLMKERLSTWLKAPGVLCRPCHVNGLIPFHPASPSMGEMNKIINILILLSAPALANLLTLGKWPNFPPSDSHTICTMCIGYSHYLHYVSMRDLVCETQVTQALWIDCDTRSGYCLRWRFSFIGDRHTQAFTCSHSDWLRRPEEQVRIPSSGMTCGTCWLGNSVVVFSCWHQMVEPVIISDICRPSIHRYNTQCIPIHCWK